MLLESLRLFIHYGLHLLFPGIIAWYFYNSTWKKTWIILLLTMLVDLDHLVANPIFDANRCSIGYHPLHSLYAIVAYFILLFFPKSRIIAIGLLLHMLTDFIDCQWI
jgi:hypothetical protein